MDDGMIGEIRIFAGNFAPRNWAFCEGQLLAISQNDALFSILGTTYGGDGRTTFGLPDLRGRTAIAPGSGPGLPSYNLGQKGGQYAVTLNTTQLSVHNHGFAPRASSDEATTSNPENNFPAVTGNLEYHTSSDTFEGAGTTGFAGGSQSHDNMTPYQSIYYIICLQGIYPSRN